MKQFTIAFSLVAAVLCAAFAYFVTLDVLTFNLPPEHPAYSIQASVESMQRLSRFTSMTVDLCIVEISLVLAHCWTTRKI